VTYAPEPGTGTWSPVRKGDCTIWYHNPPGAEQRQNRHERAQREQTSVERSNDDVRACGREVLAEYRHLPEYRDLATDFARGMRKDCGIYGPQAAGIRGTDALMPPSAWKMHSRRFGTDLVIKCGFCRAPDE
jgi:hypothetical protein